MKNFDPSHRQSLRLPILLSAFHHRGAAVPEPNWRPCARLAGHRHNRGFARPPMELPRVPGCIRAFFVPEPLPQTKARSLPRRPPAARRASGSKGEVALELSETAKLRTWFQRDPRWCGPQEIRSRRCCATASPATAPLISGVHDQKKKPACGRLKRRTACGVWANRPSTIT